MDIDAIRGLIPHRYPFLLIDSVTLIDEKRAEGVKNVTANEPYFAGHFPDYPIMPGVMIAEALAQTAGVLLLSNLPELRSRVPLFLGIERARFRRPVRPGDVLRLSCEVIGHRATIWKLKGVARVGDEVACQIELLVGFGSR